MSRQSGTADATNANPLASPDPWNLVVDGYEEINRPFLEQFSRSGLAKLRYGPRTRAIDIACGPGTTALLLARKVRHVTCVDFSVGMLDRLRRNASAAGVDNITIVEADGQVLPFADESFDLGVSMFGLMFFPDRKRGFAELHRVLAPDGQALVSSWAPADRSPLVRTIFAALQPDDAEPQKSQGLSGLEDPAVFEAEMREAGFTEIRIEAVEHGVDVEEVAQFWDQTVRSVAPITLLKHNSSAEEWMKIERHALGRLAQMLAGRLPATLSTTAWLATARKA
jgi:ubiquinone/menaquinone biosynthesis C-methylase UbiE